MTLHCGQCGKDLVPANIHRCSRCGLPYCRSHVKHHECEPRSREELAKWASSFEKGAEEEKGELPLGSTYRPVSGARLFSAEFSKALFLWIIGIGAIIGSSQAFMNEFSSIVLITGIAFSLLGSVMIARTLTQMHNLSRSAAFIFALIFMAIPALVVVLVI